MNSSIEQHQQKQHPMAAFASSFTGASLLAKSSSSSLTGTNISTTPRRKPSSTSTSSPTTPRAVLGRQASTSWGVQTEKKFRVTVEQNNGKEVVVEVDSETDLRKGLLKAGVDVYTLGGKFRNCGGGGQCGTCLISVEDGVYSVGGRTPREEHLLADKPMSWRLACRTKITGDVTIRTKPQA